MAENEKETRLTRRGRRPAQAALDATHYLQVNVHENRRVVRPFTVTQVRNANGITFGRTELCGQVYRVRLMERVAAWYISDEQGRRLPVFFPQFADLSDESQRAMEANSAAPHIWEDEERGISERTAQRRKAAWSRKCQIRRRK